MESKTPDARMDDCIPTAPLATPPAIVVTVEGATVVEFEEATVVAAVVGAGVAAVGDGVLGDGLGVLGDGVLGDGVLGDGVLADEPGSAYVYGDVAGPT